MDRAKTLASRPKRAPLASALLRLQLDRSGSAAPVYQQIRAAVRQAMADGSVAAGERLPPERDLSRALRVSRSTVMRAYQELAADGLVTAAPSVGTVVASQTELEGWSRDASAGGWTMGLPPLAGPGTDRAAIRDVDDVMRREGSISFALSVPPHDLVPVREIADALQEALAGGGAGALAFGPVEGTHELRDALADRMRESGGMAPGDGVLVVSGSTQGLSLAARVLVERGDEVVVSTPTYLGIIQCFEMAGARLIGVPVDSDGIRTDSLAEALARRRVRLILLQPNYHNPTGTTLTPERREQVLWLARRYSVPILEDDPYGALHYGPRPPGTLKEMDRNGLVVYLNTFSKTIAPGLRVGWMCGPAAVMTRLALAKQASDLNTNSLGQAIVTSLLRSGRYDAAVNRLREGSAERMGMLLGELDGMEHVLSRDRDPSGGYHVWCSLKVGDAHSVVAAAARAGVAVLSGTAFYPAGSHPSAGADRIRVSIPPSEPGSIQVGLRRLRTAMEQLPERPPRTLPMRLTAVVV